MNIITRLIRELTEAGLESFGRYYSSYRGFVYDVNDPLNLNRIKVLVPEVYGNELHDYWAIPKNLYSGEGYGIQMLPKKGDMVWINFERGHPSKPTWSHGYRSKNEVIDDEDLKDVNCTWIKTPGGNLVKINDTKKYIHIRTSNGFYVEINDKSVSAVADGISLGTLDKSKFSAVLGEPNEECLEDAQKVLQDFLESLQKDLLVAQAAGSPFLPYTNILKTVPIVLEIAKQLKNKIPKTLSKKVTLD